MAAKLSRFLCPVAATLVLAFLSGCATTGSGTQVLNPNHPQFVARQAEIAAEPRGDYYIGRRFWIEGTRFWGYVRRPGQQWMDAKLVVLNESQKLAPDRLPERAVSGPSHGYDHNYEYRLQGYFSGQEIYDPNSDQILPEFVLQGYSLRDQRPGFLFHPDQVFANNRVPKPPQLSSSAPLSAAARGGGWR